MEERIPDNKCFNEENERKIQRYQELKKMVDVLRKDLTYRSFICELIEDCKTGKPDVDIIFDTSFFDEVIDENELNRPYGYLRQFDILLVDKNHDAIAICYHPAISADYPVPVDLERFGLHHCVQLLFMPDDTYRTRPENGNGRYYFEYSRFLLLLKKALQPKNEQFIEKNVQLFVNSLQIIVNKEKQSDAYLAPKDETPRKENSRVKSKEKREIPEQEASKTRDEIFEDLKKTRSFDDNKKKRLLTYLDRLVKTGSIQYLKHKDWYVVCEKSSITQRNIAFWLKKVFVDILDIKNNGGVPWSIIEQLIRDKNQDVFKYLRKFLYNQRYMKDEEELLNDLLKNCKPANEEKLKEEDLFPPPEKK